MAQAADKSTTSKPKVGGTMDANQLRLLLAQKEYGTLEFKQQWHEIDHPDSMTARRQKDELAKDILSLANGNAIVAGEQAYLVIGADNQINSDGTRNTYGVDDAAINSQRLQQIVNERCDPPLEEIYCEYLVLDGNRLAVVTIPPTPHLYETTRKITPTGRSFDEHTVLVRHGDRVDSASAKEREKILLLKRFAFSERTNAPPIAFGVAVGAIAGGAIASGIAGTELGASKAKWPLAALVGTLLGSFIGGVSGYAYRSYHEIRPDWYRKPRIARIIMVSGGLLGSTSVWIVSKYIGHALKKIAVRRIADA